jgi:hypothetical protein
VTRVRTVVEQHRSDLTAYAVIASDHCSHLKGTTIIEATINGEDVGRRSIKQWDAGRWFIELPKSLLKKAGLRVGDAFELQFEVADATLPAELADRIARDPRAAARWSALSPARQRLFAEHVRAAKQATTRSRRAEAVIASLGC